MSQASQARHEPDRRHKIESQRAAARRARQRRNRLLIAGGAVVVVIIVVVAVVLAQSGTSSSLKTPPNDGPTGTALAATVKDLTTVPASVLDQVGGGGLSTADIGSPTATGGGYLTPISGSPLTAGDKPEVLYVGANFCPYCAAERWPLIVALSRFGTFAGLSTTRSAIEDGAGQAEVYPSTPTWTFSGASYTSQYLTFTGVEQYTNIPDAANGGYTTLKPLTSAQQAVMSASGDSSGAFPYINIGGAYVQLSLLAPYTPQDLHGLTWTQITAAVRDPSSALGQEIDGSANYLTAAICKVTGDKPATVCTPAVTALQSHLG